MSDHVFATALRDYLKLKDESNKFSELKKEAFVVFNKGFDLNQLLPRLNGPWLELCDWNLNTDNTHRFAKVPDFAYVSNCFTQLISGEINRNKFYEQLQEVCGDIADHQIGLSALAKKAYADISQLYDTSAKANTHLSFIFTEPKVKKFFMQFCGDITRHGIGLSELTEKAYADISQLYDTSAKANTHFSFIFNEPKVKEFFMQLIES